jgi:hypothetical protein
MKVDADFTRGASRLIYPELPDPLTSADLKRFFSPSPRRTRVGAYHCPFVNLPGGVVGSIDGLPSRLAPQIKDAHRRYVFTTFAYGCGLGPTQAARHLNGVVSADQLSFVDTLISRICEPRPPISSISTPSSSSRSNGGSAKRRSRTARISRRKKTICLPSGTFGTGRPAGSPTGTSRIITLRSLAASLPAEHMKRPIFSMRCSRISRT